MEIEESEEIVMKRKWKPTKNRAMDMSKVNRFASNNEEQIDINY